jgi:hypothetical protein
VTILKKNFNVLFSVEIGREKLRLGWEFDLPKFESRFSENRNSVRQNFSPTDDIVVLECVAKPPTFNDVAKTLSKKEVESISPKKGDKCRKERLRRIGLKQNSDEEGSSESDLSLSMSSSSERLENNFENL